MFCSGLTAHNKPKKKKKTDQVFGGGGEWAQGMELWVHREFVYNLAINWGSFSMGIMQRYKLRGAHIQKEC